jgi:polysaccharide export outer membrane protein
MRKLFITLFLTLLSFCVHADDKKQDYLLGAGDMVRITVYGNPDLTTETRVTSSGAITFPLLGEVMVGGMTPGAAEKKISTALEEGGFLKQAQINFVVLQFQSQLVSVLGEVNRPGRYPLDRPSTLTDVMAMASGATANGSEIVTVASMRDGKPEKHEYDLREWFDHGQASQNPTIHGDDIIYVQAREVSVLGQVNRPGKYSVVSGVRNVGDFLSMAGGIAPGGADTIVVSILRNGKLDKREIDVDQLFRSGDTAANIELRGGDMIYVPRQPMFYIYGEVQRPGSFRLERNMTVAQALSVGGGLTLRGTERGIRIKRRDAAGAIQTIEPKSSDILQADDVIQIQESLF